MAVSANSIITPQIPRSATSVASLANTVLTDSPTGTVKLAGAGPNGARLVKLAVTPRGTVTATQVQLFRSSDGGVTKRLVRTAVIPAFTLSNTALIATTDLGYSDDGPMILGANEELYGAISVALAAGVVFEAEWADY